MDLPVECVGRLERERMEEYYKKAVLIFPSYLETVGLPLIEAQVYNTFILAADCEYAKESLEEYDKKVFFSINDHEELTNLMKAVILGQIQ